MMLYGSALFYDLGIRRGDLFFMTIIWLTPTIFANTTGTEEALARQKELLAGTIQCYPVGFRVRMDRRCSNTS